MNLIVKERNRYLQMTSSDINVKTHRPTVARLISKKDPLTKSGHTRKPTFNKTHNIIEQTNFGQITNQQQ